MTVVEHAIGGQLVRKGRGGITPPPALTRRFPGDTNSTKSGQIFWGAAVSGDVAYANSVASHESAAGVPLGVYRTYFSTTAHITPPDGGLFVQVRDAHAHNRLPWVSFKYTDWAAAAAGANDAEMDALIAELESYPKPVFLALNHEPENDGKSATDWRNMQARFRSRLTAYGNTHGGIKRIAFCPVLMGFTWDTASGRNPEDWWVANTWDFYGVDYYADTNQDIERAAWTSFVTWTQGKGLPFGIGEWGLRSTDTNGLTKFNTFFNHNTDKSRDCVAMSYFDSNQGDGTPGYILQNTNGLLDQFHADMKDPRCVHMSDMGY